MNDYNFYIKAIYDTDPFRHDLEVNHIVYMNVRTVNNGSKFILEGHNDHYAVNLENGEIKPDGYDSFQYDYNMDQYWDLQFEYKEACLRSFLNLYVSELGHLSFETCEFIDVDEYIQAEYTSQVDNLTIASDKYAHEYKVKNEQNGLETDVFDYSDITTAFEAGANFVKSLNAPTYDLTKIDIEKATKWIEENSIRFISSDGTVNNISLARNFNQWCKEQNKKDNNNE